MKTLLSLQQKYSLSKFFDIVIGLIEKLISCSSKNIAKDHSYIHSQANGLLKDYYNGDKSSQDLIDFVYAVEKKWYRIAQKHLSARYRKDMTMSLNSAIEKHLAKYEVL